MPKGHGVVGADRSLIRKAQGIMSRAIKRGDLVRQPCEACGSTGTGKSPVHGHHDDYTRPLDVRWLCPACHTREHMKPQSAPPSPPKCSA